MNWRLRFRLKHYLANSIWIYPSICMLAAMVLVRVSHRIDDHMGWQSSMQPDTARTVLSTLAASMFTFIVFVSSALLVAVQLASAQLTPRIIAILFQSHVTRTSLSIFVFAFTFAVATLVRINTTAPWLTILIAAYGCVFSLIVFLYLIDQVGKFLRPSGALRTVAKLGRKVTKAVYPNRLADVKSESQPIQFPTQQPTIIVESASAGVVLAFDAKGLFRIAQKRNIVIELVPQVGDHIETGEPLLRVFGKTDLGLPTLSQAVVIGLERTLEQDPTFAFRIMVDIASKGLSPAINDPTTAVLAIDQIHRLLRYVGGRDLDTGLVYDAGGQLRLVFRTPDWEDFVRLAVTEIRHFGGESIQVARRLRAMLENLIANLPPARAMLLKEELAILKRAAERYFSEPEDRALAEVSDAQGVGGKRLRT